MGVTTTNKLLRSRLTFVEDDYLDTSFPRGRALNGLCSLSKIITMVTDLADTVMNLARYPEEYFS